MIDSISSTVISTRVRLARNLDGYNFPNKLRNESQAKEIIRMVNNELNKLDEFNLYFMNSITKAKAQSLKENYLISEDLIQNKKYGAVLISKDREVSIMINEEDHLREQCIKKGLQLTNCYNQLSSIDDLLSSKIPFAFDERFGYLTSCPTNLGTGLRVSVMLFLPGLTQNKVMPEVIRNVSRLGMTVRGIYGEGSEAEGYIYQMSNEVTLGLAEEEIIELVKSAVKIVTDLEIAERMKLNKADPIGVQDRCRRSLGILTNCAKLSSDEFLQYMANVKLGVALGYIKIDDISILDDLLMAVRPANVNERYGYELQANERDVYRAELVGSSLRKLIKR